MIMIAAVALAVAAADGAFVGASDAAHGPSNMLAIVERVCLRCHHVGGNVPYEFRDGAMLRRVAQTAAEALRKETMPPWLPSQHASDFLDVPSITQDERANLIRWFAEGAEGTESWVAPPPSRASSEPGAVTLRFGEGWQTPAEPDLLYARTFLQQIDGAFPLRFRGLEYRPAEAGSIEMVMLNADTTGMGRALDERDGGVGAAFHADLGTIPAGALGAAGVQPAMRLPDGYTFAIAPRADLLAEAHARALGRSAGGAFDVTITPSRASDTRVVESYVVGAVTTGGAPTRANLTIEYICDTLDAPMEVIAILPNTGIRCASYDLNLVRRTGAVEGVLNIPTYRAWADRMYVRRNPLRVEAGDHFTLKVSHTDGFAFLHTHASAVMLVAPIAESASRGATVVAANAAAKGVAPPVDDVGVVDPVTMIDVPAGTAHIKCAGGLVEVAVPALRVARNETSIAEFARVMGRAPRAVDTNDTRDSYVDPEIAQPIAPVDAALPTDLEVACASVTFYDALEYCNALSKTAGLPEHYALTEVKRRGDGSILSAVIETREGAGYRLLSEAEWEYIASAAGESDAWCIIGEQPAPSAPRHAAQGKPNALGIVNLGGNVWEWCDDGYSEARDCQRDARAHAPTNRGRVVKGGSFADTAAACAPAFRSGIPASSRTAMVGLRVARRQSSQPSQPSQPSP